MSIQYISESVIYSAPDGVQTDYEALISITFSTLIDGVISAPSVYQQNVTGGTSNQDILMKYNEARKAVNDQTLLDFASSSSS